MIERIKCVFRSRFGKDVIITIIGQIIVLLVAFGLNKWLSIQLGTIGYGEFSIAKRTAGVIAYVMLVGIGIAIPKYLSVYRQLGNQIKEARCIISALLMITTISSITICILFILRVYIARILFDETGYTAYILPILLYALSIAVTTFAFSYYCGLNKFSIYNISQIFVQITTLLIAFIIDKNVIALLYAWSIVTGVYGIYVCTRVWEHYYPKAIIKSFKKDLKPAIGELASFCFPRVPGEFVLFAYSVVPLIIINHKMGMETSAYFAAATTINTMITPLFSFVGVVLLPLVSKSIVSNQFDEAEKKVKMLGIIYLIIGLLGIAFVEVFTPFVINILFSQDYQYCVPIVRIMILAVLPNAYYLLLRNPLDAMSKIPYNSINLTISFIVLNVLVFLSWNTIGYAVSFVVAYGILGILTLWSWHTCKKDICLKNAEVY